MDLEQVVQYAVHGITVGSVYALVAIGFNIIYNTTGIINFAQGEFVVVGAMIAISLAAVLPLPAAILLAVLATALLGGLLERIFIRPEEVMRRIADFRAGEKHDPSDYARRTVTKAQTELGSSTRSDEQGAPNRTQ